MTNFSRFELLESLGYFEFGAIVEGKTIREAFDIKEISYPAFKREINEQQLQELSATDYIRNKLLNEGKYLKQTKDSYRVLLPSENANQVLSYMSSADNKLKRGLKLNSNTPSQYKINPNDEVRAIMKQDYIKEQK